MKKRQQVVPAGNGWRAQIDIRNQGSIYSKSCRTVEEAKEYVEPLMEVAKIIRYNELEISDHREGIREACEFVKNMMETNRDYSRRDILREIQTPGIRSGDKMVPVDQPQDSVKTEDVVDLLDVSPHNDAQNVPKSNDPDITEDLAFAIATKELRTLSEAFRRFAKERSDACCDEVYTSSERLHVIIKLLKDSSTNKRRRS